MDRFVCAIDVGTRSARAGIFDSSGRALSHHTRPIGLWEEDGMRAEHASEDIWQAVCAAVRDAVAGANVAPGSVAAVAFDATCSLVLRDTADAPLPLGPEGRDTIAWFDHRAVAEAAECTATGHRVLDHAGGSMSPEMQCPKLMWLKRNRPDLWPRMGRAMDLTDFLTWRASGQDLRSTCTLVAKWTHLPHAGGWQRDFLDAIGLDDLAARASVPAMPTAPGTAAGPLTPAAADELGLTTACTVAVGLIDAFAGTLGVMGGLAPRDRAGALAMIAGTSTCVMSMSDMAWRGRGIWGPYPGAILPGLWVNEGGQSATGALLDHVLHTYAPDRDASPAAHRRVAARISAALAREGGGFGRGLDILPDFNGNRTPLADPMAYGVVSGLTLDTGEGALDRLYWRAAVALALGLRQIVAQMETGGTRIERLLITGGHARNALLMQLYADATGREVQLSTQPDSVLLGTAMTAAAAAGLHPGLPAAAQAMAGRPGCLKPDPSRRAGYDRDYAVFLRMQAHRAELSAMPR